MNEIAQPIHERDLEAERGKLLALMEEAVGEELGRRLQTIDFEAGTLCIEPVLVETDGTIYADQC